MILVMNMIAIMKTMLNIGSEHENDHGNDHGNDISGNDKNIVILP